MRAHGHPVPRIAPTSRRAVLYALSISYSFQCAFYTPVQADCRSRRGSAQHVRLPLIVKSQEPAARDQIRCKRTPQRTHTAPSTFGTFLTSPCTLWAGLLLRNGHRIARHLCGHKDNHDYVPDHEQELVATLLLHTTRCARSRVYE